MRRDRWLIIAAILLLGVVGGWLGARSYFRASHHRAPTIASAQQPSIETTFSPTPSPTLSPPVVDFNRALNAALQEVDPRTRAMAFGNTLTKWFAEDPEAALAYVQNMRPGPERTEGMFVVIGGLVKKDPARAVALAGEMTRTREDQSIYSLLFDQVGHRDIDEATRLLDQVQEGEGRMNAFRAVAVSRADKNVLEALDWAKTLSKPEERSAAIEATLIVRAKRDPQRTIGLAQQLLTGDALERTLTEAMRQLTASNTREAAKMLAVLPEGELKTRATLDVVRAFAAEQPQTALSWIDDLRDAHLRQLALDNVLDFWVTSDPNEAAKYVSQMPNGTDQAEAAAHLAKILGKSDPAKAIDWAKGLEGESRTAALVSLASGWAQKDPAEATQWAASLPAEDPVRIDAMRDALSYWRLQDSTAAADFVSNLSKADQAKLSVNPR